MAALTRATAQTSRALPAIGDPTTGAKRDHQLQTLSVSIVVGDTILLSFASSWYKATVAATISTTPFSTTTSASVEAEHGASWFWDQPKASPQSKCPPRRAQMNVL